MISSTLSLMSLLLVSSIAENPLVDRFRRASLHCQTSSGQTTTRRRRLPVYHVCDLDMLAGMVAGDTLAGIVTPSKWFTNRRVEIFGDPQGKRTIFGVVGRKGMLLDLPEEGKSHYRVKLDEHGQTVSFHKNDLTLIPLDEPTEEDGWFTTL